MPGLRQLFQRECAPTVGECGKAHPIDEPGWEAGSRNPNAKPWKRTRAVPALPCPSLGPRSVLSGRTAASSTGRPRTWPRAEKGNQPCFACAMGSPQGVEGLGECVVEGGQAVCPPDLSKKTAASVMVSQRYSEAAAGRPSSVRSLSEICSASLLPSGLSSRSRQRQATRASHGFGKARCLQQSTVRDVQRFPCERAEIATRPVTNDAQVQHVRSLGANASSI